MTTRVFHSGQTTRYEADFKSIPYTNLVIDFKENEASTASFTSTKLLREGDRIRITGDNHIPFGGQVLKIKESITDAAYDYELIDYTRLFFTKTWANVTNKTSTDILKGQMKTFGLSSAGIKKTKLKHKELLFRDINLWDMIQQLRYLDYKAGQRIECYVNQNGTLIYRPLPETHTGYYFDTVYDYSQETDASNIITNVDVVTVDEDNATIPFVEVYSENLIARWGHITEQIVCEGSSKDSNPSAQPTTTAKLTDAEINKIEEQIRKKHKGTPYKECDCFCTSDRIFKDLKSNKVACKIIEYCGSGSSGRHRTVKIKNTKGKWRHFNYDGFPRLLRVGRTSCQLKDPWNNKIYEPY